MRPGAAFFPGHGTAAALLPGFGFQRVDLLEIPGAHPAVLPDNYPAGSDFEKIKWTPGIYDSVSVFFCANPVIAT